MNDHMDNRPDRTPGIILETRDQTKIISPFWLL